MMAALLCEILLFATKWQQKMQTIHYDSKQCGVGIYDIN